MNEVLQTQEVGSIAKPNWRVVGVSKALATEEYLDALTWGSTLDINPLHVQKILAESVYNKDSYEYITGWKPEPSAVKKLAALYAVRLQEKAGLDIVYDGEQDRSEMYEHCVRRTKGFESRGRIRVFDNRTFHKYAVVDEPRIEKPWHSEEIERIKSLTDHSIKVPITGPYTIADWSFDEYFGGDKAELVDVLAERVTRMNILSILDQGIEWVQIDEPAAGTKKGEIPLFIESFNKATTGLLGKFSIHLCFSEWGDFIPHLAKLENCHQLSIEFANRDGHNLGTSADDRPAYEILREIHQELPKTVIGLGVVTVHEDKIEPPELVRDRILRAVDIVGDPSLIYPSPDCGLRTRSWEVAYKKLSSVVQGTQLAKEKLGV